MKPSEIKALFPITVDITQEIIDRSIYADRNNCVAATTLKTVLPQELHSEIDWGTGIGHIGGITIRSKFIDNDGKEQDFYIQHSTIKPSTVKFIVPKN